MFRRIVRCAALARWTVNGGFLVLFDAGRFRGNGVPIRQRLEPLLLNHLAPEVFLRRQRIVRRAAERQVGCSVIPASSKRLDVVKLEAMDFGTLPSVHVDVTAAVANSREDGAPDGGGNVTSAPARVGRFGIFGLGIFARRLPVGASRAGVR